MGYFDLLSTLVRYGLLALAGHLASRGYFDVAIVDYLAGLGVALFAFGWYYFQKLRPPEHPDPMQEVQ